MHIRIVIVTLWKIIQKEDFWNHLLASENFYISSSTNEINKKQNTRNLKPHGITMINFSCV